MNKMSLDEAIDLCCEIIEKNNPELKEYKLDYFQIMKWLIELKVYREKSGLDLAVIRK